MSFPRRPLLAALALVFTVALPLPSLAAPRTATPNIVLIFIDDLGYADIGPFGNTQLRTPHLDQLAREGRKFTTFYATPVCSMSRASLLTGCYNTRISIPGVLFPSDGLGLNPTETTLAEIVKPRGYATACIGKWHLGEAPEFLPTRHGFDEYFGLPYSNDMQGGRKYKDTIMPPLPLIRGETTIETQPDQAQLTRRYTEEAVAFIRARKDAPFFLYLAHTMPHVPLAASAAFKGKSAQGLLGDTIEELDWSVGQVMAALKELKLDENTLVIFTSDNGPDRRPAPPFRGAKTTSFEGGVRAPCIMRWPGQIPTGTTCDQLTGNIDLLPTFAKLVGTRLDPDRVIDGREITSLLFEAQPAAVRDTHLYFGGGASPLVAIRQGDWKLFLREPAEGPAAKAKAKAADAGPALYNLVTDISETTNVAAAHPEIVSRLRAEATKRGDEITANRRPPGRTSL